MMSSSILQQFGVKTAPQSLLQNNVTSDIFPNGSDPEIDMSVVPEEKKTYRQSTLSYGGYTGLPYQDHNYVAPPPPTPPASPPPVAQKSVVNGHIDIEDVDVSCNTVVVTTPVAPVSQSDPSPVDDSVTRCICDFDHDDGYMICCDKCGVWQHVDCMGVDRNNIPDVYKCEECEPRKVNKPHAIKVQTKKRELLLHDSSATETEDETPHGKSRRAAKGKKKENNKLNNRQKKFKKNRRDKDKDGRRKPLNGQNRRKLLGVKLDRDRQPKPRRTRKLTENSALAPPPCTGSSNVWEPSSFIVADSNNVSGDLQKLLATRKYNGQHSKSNRSFPKPELLDQLINVKPISDTRKILEAAENIPTNKVITEVKGNIMLREQCDKNGDFLKRAHPYMLCYTKREGLDICIDTSRYGNDARYIRRSCSPNAEIQDFIDNGEIHFFVYSLEDISEGEEITIPFDFNYQDCSYSVECACSRPSCPVVRFHNNKDDEEANSDNVTSPPFTRGNRPMKKKRRATKSTEEKVEDLNSSSGSTRKFPSLSPVTGHSAPGKRRKLTPISPLKVNTSGVKHEPQKPFVSSPTGESSTSPVRALGSPKGESGGVVMSDEDKAAEAERRKKMTREERKMEAIMKAFAKLEKREERRKEAIARIHGPGTTGRRDSGRDEDEVEEEPPPPPPKELKPDRNKMLNRKGKKKSRPTTPARRQSRAGSSMSAADSSADENSSVAPTPSSTPGPQSVTSEGPPSSASAPSSALPSEKAFRFPKTKKHLMNEWLHEKSQDLQKPLSIKTEVSEDQEREAEFVRCVPSPHTNTLSHLRRNSVSSGTVPRVSTPSQVQLDHSMGSAKKRWLRQAMYETSHPPSGSTSPVPIGSMSPNANGYSCSYSPGAASPIDFVTPLKKRRLARESVSMENPPNPSTPTPPASAEPTESLSSAGTTPGSEDKPKLSEDGTLRNGFRPHMSTMQSHSALFDYGSVNASSMETDSKEEVVSVKSEEDKISAIPSCSESIRPRAASLSVLGKAETREPMGSVACAEDFPCTSREAAPTVKEEPQPSVTRKEIDNAMAASEHVRSPAARLAEFDNRQDNVDTTDRPSRGFDLVQITFSQSSTSASSSTVDNNKAQCSDKLREPAHVDRTLPQPSGCGNISYSVNLHNSCENSEQGISEPTEEREMTVSQTVDSSERRNFAHLNSASGSAVVDSSERLPTAGNVCDSTDTTCGASRRIDNTVSLVSCSSASEDADKVTSDLRSDQSQPAPGMGDSESSSTVDSDRTCCSTTSPLDSSTCALVVPGTSASSSTDHNIAEEAISEAPSSEGNQLAQLPEASGEADCGPSQGDLEDDALAESTPRPSSSMPAAADRSIEEGELDSSFSDLDTSSSQLKKVRGSPLVDQTVSCSSDLPAGSAPVPRDEKEEGEITDDEPDYSRTSTPKAESSTTASSQAKQSSNSNEGSSEISSTNHRWSATQRPNPVQPSSSQGAQPSSNQEDLSASQPSTSTHHGTGASNCSISSTATKNNTDKTSSPGSDACVDSSSAPCGPDHQQPSNSSNSIPMENSVSSTASDYTEEAHSLHHISAESSHTSIDTSPIAKSTSPSSSSSIVTAGASSSSSKKKVSLLEYRKRLKQKGVPRRSASSSSSGSTTPTQREATPSTLAPLPLFGQSTSPTAKKGLSVSPLPGGRGESDEDDVRWSTSATAAERMREQTPLSLTERLRKEFGLDASEEEDLRTGSPDTPPPPPPPVGIPPPPPGRPPRDREDDNDDDPPPPPPPGQPAYQVGIVQHLGQVQMMAPPPMVPPPQAVTSPIIVPPGSRPPIGAQGQPQLVPAPLPLGQRPARIIQQTQVRGPPGPVRAGAQPSIIQGQRMPAPRQRNGIPSLMSLSFPAKPYTNSAETSGSQTAHHAPTSSSQGTIAQGYGPSATFDGYEGTNSQAGYGQASVSSGQPSYSRPTPTSSSGQQAYVQPQPSSSGQPGYGPAPSSTGQAGYDGQTASVASSHGYNHHAQQPTAAASFATPSSSQPVPTPRQYESYSTSSTSQPPQSRNFTPTRYSNNYK